MQEEVTATRTVATPQLPTPSAVASSRQSVGVVLIQLGTPDQPTYWPVQRYLRQFLSDPRLIELPRWRWLPILHLFILPLRPFSIAGKYRRIWHEQTGLPLLHYTRRQAELLQTTMPNVLVRFGMQVGNPPLGQVVHEMIAAGVEKLIAIPLYPQYSATTTASAADTLFKALMQERRVPSVRFVNSFYDQPSYLDALATIARDELAKLTWTPDHVLISFHGIPMKYAQRGDPYATHVVRTTRGLVERMGWPRQFWTQTYQSKFGRDPWLLPATDAMAVKLAQRGVKRLFVLAPGFTTDCLETIDELGHELKEEFVHAGGQELHQCPCLNDHPAWINTLRSLVETEGQGWI